MKPVLLGPTLLASMLMTVPAFAEKPVNLLTLPQARVVSDGLSEFNEQQISPLLDDDPKTLFTTDAIDGTPVELVFGFDGATMAPASIKLVLGQDQKNPPPGRIDILASTVSANAGFTSLRSEVIDPLRRNHSFRFQASAAKWIRVRLIPADGAGRVELADISVIGRKGPPETSYVFGETPAAALEIIRAMETLGSAGLELTQEEQIIFAQARNGDLDQQAFESIALLASGVTDVQKRQSYLTQLDQLAGKASAAVQSAGSTQEKGASLLRFLHQTVFRGGYLEKQTNLSTVLDEGVFNCVSSAVLYNAIGKRLGLDVRAIEVPDHAFSIVYDGLDHMDVETTTSEGFNPHRDRIAEFENLTGFRYIPQSNKAKRREINAAGLAALIYYNHGVTHLSEGRYREALSANFRAMSLDPEFSSAATNALAALGRWSSDLADKKQWRQATEVAGIGVRLAPKDRGLASNHKAIWQQWAFEESDQGRPESALEIINRAERAIPDSGFAEMRAAVFFRPAEQLIEQGQWADALALTANAPALLSGDARSSMHDWRTVAYIRWAQAMMKAEAYETALSALVQGHAEYADDQRLRRSARYLGQTWSESLSFEPGIAALESIIDAVNGKGEFDGVVSNFLRLKLMQNMQTLPVEQAGLLAERAARLVSDKAAAELGPSVYETYGHALIDQRDWQAAAEIYAAGLKAFPGSRILQTNARYVIQEWQRHANTSGGVEALQSVVVALRQLFPQFAEDTGLGEAEVLRQIDDRLKQKDFAKARELLQSAQLLLSPERYRETIEFIVDREAQEAMRTAEWQRAAQIYAAALRELGPSKIFTQNVGYITQEWSRAAADANGAAAIADVIEQMQTLFPGREDIAATGLNALKRMVNQDVKAGRFEAAKSHIRAAAGFVPRDDLGTLVTALYGQAAAVALDAKQWREALQAYADGLSIRPDARQLTRNIPYIYQEWSREVLATGGPGGLPAMVREINSIRPGDPDLQDVLTSVVAQEVQKFGQDNRHQSAFDLINALEAQLSAESLIELKVRAYDGWARQLMDAGEWQAAVQIYEMGLSDVKQNRLLENNLRFAQSKL